ncbi:hypothetical protein F2Q70_00009641 [Brassica cretica]|uniref:Uncharacterized protein n=1 Tax=Brassica cretica TaxID=69181 RepID=A0A8S9M1L5_BRACR|nr:hypothetical protein F2Q70_00009641 [Brassica cretica]
MCGLTRWRSAFTLRSPSQFRFLNDHFDSKTSSFILQNQSLYLAVKDLYGQADHLYIFEDSCTLNQDFPEAEETTFSELTFVFRVHDETCNVKGCGLVVTALQQGCLGCLVNPTVKSSLIELKFGRCIVDLFILDLYGKHDLEYFRCAVRLSPTLHSPSQFRGNQNGLTVGGGSNQLHMPDLYEKADHLYIFEDSCTLNQDFPEAEETTFSELTFETQKRTVKIIVRIKKLTEKNLDVMRMKRRGSGNECG